MSIIYTKSDVDHKIIGNSFLFVSTISLLLILSMMLGGATTGEIAADYIVYIVSLPVIILVSARSTHNKIQDLLGIFVLFCAFIIPLMQIFPLSSNLWQPLPGRAFVGEIYRTAGLTAPSLPISLDPEASWDMFVSMLPAAALFLAMRQATLSERLILISVLGIIGAVAALQGVAQALQGAGPMPWLAHLQHHTNTAIGPFVNRNHFAALMYVLLPLSAAMGLIHFSRPHPVHAFAALGWGFLFLSALLGLGASISRAGISLGIVACLGALLLAWTGRRQSRSSRWPLLLFSAVLICILLVQQFGLVELIQIRSGEEDPRAIMAGHTLTAIGDFLPVGTGFGTFPRIYQMYEYDTEITDLAVNHAHNDYLELALEGGIPAILALALFGIWLMRQCWTIWTCPPRNGSAMSSLILARGATIAVLLLLTHSLVDYPLRTTALMSVFGLLCGVMSVPIPASQRR